MKKSSIQKLAKIAAKCREEQDKYLNKQGDNGCMNSGSEWATAKVLGLLAESLEELCKD